MKVLGIESSCDETAASVVEDGNRLLSNVVFSSMNLQAQYGGVVPEIAARSHIEAITGVIHQALYEAKYGKGTAQSATQQSAKNIPSKSGYARLSGSELSALWEDIDAIAVTYGAGLGGSLLVGVLTARTLAITHNKPLYACNHVEAHVYANFITSAGPAVSDYKLPASQPEFPLLALIVSGGHSQLVVFRDHFDYRLLGQTNDDAIGEAFDKVAKIIGLPYPGGPSVGKKALEGDPYAFSFPKARMSEKYDFSFSGVKTAVLRAAQNEIGEDHTFASKNIAERLTEAQKANIAASFQRVAIETVVDKAVLAFEEFSPTCVVIAGGVAASPELRRQMSERIPLPIQYTDPRLCTDNGAMIATLGCFHMKYQHEPADPYTLDIAPNLSM